MLDVWFSSDCVCFKIEHLSNINEMQAFNTPNVYGVPVWCWENNKLLWVKICSVPNNFNTLSRENFQYTIDDDFFLSLALQLSLTVTNCSLDGLLQTQLKLHSAVLILIQITIHLFLWLFSVSIEEIPSWKRKTLKIIYIVFGLMNFSCFAITQTKTKIWNDYFWKFHCSASF